MAKKKRKDVSVLVDSGLLAAAARHKINLSAVLEAGLRGAIQGDRAAAWRQENRAAILEYNAFVESYGIFGGMLRDSDCRP